MLIIKKRLKDSKVRRARLKKYLETSLTGIPAVKVCEAKRIIYKREADVFNPSKQEEYFAWMIDKM